MAELWRRVMFEVRDARAKRPALTAETNHPGFCRVLPTGSGTKGGVVTGVADEITTDPCAGSLLSRVAGIEHPNKAVRLDMGDVLLLGVETTESEGTRSLLPFREEPSPFGRVR